MPKPPRPWIVTRHDPIEEVDENLWCVNGDVPGFPPAAGFPRRMSIVKLSDGRLLFHNAVPVDEVTLERLRAWGKPSFLMVPHHLHAMDAHAFREKLGLDAYTSSKALEQEFMLQFIRQLLEFGFTLLDALFECVYGALLFLKGLTLLLGGCARAALESH